MQARNVWGLVVVVAACEPPPTMTVVAETKSYETVDQTYSIRLEDADGTDVLPGWKVDNFRDGDSEATQKTSGVYEMSIDWVRASGAMVHVKIPVFDLLLSDPNSNGSIWARAIPVPASLRGKKLSVLAENYANNLSGGTATLGYIDATVRSNRVGSAILESFDMKVGGIAAHSVVLDLVELNQLEMSKSAPRTRAHLVLVGAEIPRQIDHIDEISYLLLGYSNEIKDFQRLEPLFEGFLKHVQFATGVGHTYPRVESDPVRFSLGQSRAEAQKRCEALYTWTPSSKADAAVRCEGVSPEGFDPVTSLRFCANSVCALEWTKTDDLDVVLARLGRLRSELTRSVGKPEKNVVNISDPCKATLAACLADGRAAARVTWKLADGGHLTAGLEARGGRTVLVLGQESGGATTEAPEEPVKPAKLTAPSAGAQERVCSPGVTQACVGRGGCTGGQACADDGSKWMPCDCGK